MDINCSLAARLVDLAETLDDPTVDLGTGLRRLDADLQIAVDSYVGMSMTVTVGPDTVEVPATETIDPSAVQASIRVPESALGLVESGSRVTMTFYAAVSGAFVDLAADLAWSTGTALADFVLDEHRVPPTSGDHRGGLGLLSVIHQAIGTLIARGRTPEQADQQLSLRALEGGITRLAAAEALLMHALPDADPF